MFSLSLQFLSKTFVIRGIQEGTVTRVRMFWCKVLVFHVRF